MAPPRSGSQKKSSSSSWLTLFLIISPLFVVPVAYLLANGTPLHLHLDLDLNDYLDPYLDSLKASIPPFLRSKEEPIAPTDYLARAKRILRSTPLIDGHNDFPFLLRQQLQNKIYDHDFEVEKLGGHTDPYKLREGMMGGQFWSVYVPCPEDLIPENMTMSCEMRGSTGAGANGDGGKFVPELNDPNWAVRDTLEQIDITKRLIDQYSYLLELCTDPRCVRRAHKKGKIGSMIGVEGGHQTGNSLGTLRQLFDMGARYVTVTHNCDNAFGTAWTTVNASGMDADKGLTPFGRQFVREMNRLGMMVDISHVSPNTMRDILAITRAPVIFSHSGSYSVTPHLRNVQDDVLRAVKTNGGVVMVPFVSYFLNIEHPEEATVEDVVDHILWIADVAGWENVGLGSDFDGTALIARGIDDVSQWPNLIARLLARGVSDEHARMVAGDNILRAWAQIEEVAKAIQKEERPNEETWEDRLWEPEYPGTPQLFPPKGTE